jgi:L-alanine-DL-glutamate epimerase-like enolase superfamily enzyme
MDGAGPRIEGLTASAFRIPTDAPESDGTLAWDHTTMVLVEVFAGGQAGMGITYAGAAAGAIASEELAKTIVGRDAFGIERHWQTMISAVRNLGWRGACANAIAAVDGALWDLKAKLLGLPLVSLLGKARDSIEAYGSGGFTSYDVARLREQLGSWVKDDGCHAVKMKVGRDLGKDMERVRATRDAIGSASLFVDANGAYARKQALAFAEEFGALGVTWFEEPVSSDDLEGLRLLRDRAPAGLDIAAGEYGYDPFYFRHMLEAGAVDVLQADATRCGLTGFLRAAALCDAFAIPLSAHTAPSMHRHVACSAARVRHIEWFHDHVRIEQMLFDGAPRIADGRMAPDLSRPGHGIALKRQDAEKFRIAI